MYELEYKVKFTAYSNSPSESYHTVTLSEDIIKKLFPNSTSTPSSSHSSTEKLKQIVFGADTKYGDSYSGTYKLIEILHFSRMSKL